ncbi:MAG: translation initiation factor IF-2 subunit alpha [Candidatus Norongarragalinales archaeon]
MASQAPARAEYPSVGEYAVGTIKKIVDYGAFISLEEYPAHDAFLHISEVSSGWIRNIREHIKEGQRVVVLVTRVDPEKRQVDVSLKKVSDADKKRKLEEVQMEKRARKLLERAAVKLGKTIAVAEREVAPVLAAEYGDLYSAFEAFAKGEEPSKKIPGQWAQCLVEVARAEIKQKTVKVRASLKLESFAGNGVEEVRRILSSLEGLSQGKTSVKVLYLGAPNYFVDFSAPDLKSVEKVFSRAQALLQQAAGKQVEFALEKLK